MVRRRADKLCLLRKFADLPPARFGQRVDADTSISGVIKIARRCDHVLTPRRSGIVFGRAGDCDASMRETPRGMSFPVDQECTKTAERRQLRAGKSLSASTWTAAVLNLRIGVGVSAENQPPRRTEAHLSALGCVRKGIWRPPLTSICLLTAHIYVVRGFDRCAIHPASRLDRLAQSICTLGRGGLVYSRSAHRLLFWLGWAVIVFKG